MSSNNINNKPKGTKNQKKKQRNRKKKSQFQQNSNVPSSYAKAMKPIRSANVVSNKDGVRIRHTEFVDGLVLTASSVFQPNFRRYRVNPGSDTLFHWLSGVAANFEFYKFHKLHLIFVTRAATNSTGMLIMAPDFDSADSAYTSESQMCSAKGAVEGPLYRTLTLKLEPHLMQSLYKKHVVMSDGRFLTTKQDQKTVDCASIQLGYDTGTSGNYGRLMVDYDVELLCPQPSTEMVVTGGGRVTAGVSQLQSNTNLPVTSAIQTLADVVDTTRYGNLAMPYPTDIIGTVTKDFQGIAQVTSICSYPNTSAPIAGIKVLNKPAAAAPNGALIASDLTNSISKFVVDLKEGDVLQMLNPNQAAWFQYGLALGGADLAALF